MLITRIHPFSKKEITREINVTEEQLILWKIGGVVIQDAMPNLTPSEREFIKTGLTDEDWDLLSEEI